MVLGMSGLTAFAAATASTPADKGTITITTPDNTDVGTTNTYKIYKIFGATVSNDGRNTAYKLLDGYGDSNVPTGFTAANGYVTKAPNDLNAEASALADYVTKNKLQPVDTKTITGKGSVTSDALDPGYYYITTTTGSAVIVNANSNQTIKDKNELSTVDKVAGSEYSASAKKAIQAVGNDQPFTVQITKKHGAGHIVFNDTMTNMTYNEDLTVTVDGQTVAAGTDTYSVTPATENSGLTVTFTDGYVKNLKDDAVITLKYTAKITSDALQTNPATNTASLTLDNNNTTKSTNVEIYNGKLTVTKTDDNSQPLEGAGFKLKNADGKYYKYTPATATDPAKVEFVEGEANGTEVLANNGANKNVAIFAGLPAGNYTLIESKVPAGYNKASDVKNLRVELPNDEDAKVDLNQAQTIVNVKGTVLPSTGGIGTTIFYVLGAALVIGAGVVLVTRRRLSK